MRVQSYLFVHISKLYTSLTKEFVSLSFLSKKNLRDFWNTTQVLNLRKLILPLSNLRLPHQSTNIRLGPSKYLEIKFSCGKYPSKLNIDLQPETPQRLSRSPSLDRQAQSMNAVKNTMSKALSHAKIVPHQSAARGHSIYGWLDSYHTFSFGDFDDPRFSHFGSLQVLNEDRVKANSGFPTHPHRDFEIFSW